MSANMSTNVSEGCLAYDAAESAFEKALMVTAYAILIFFSLVGNTLVIAVFYKRYNQLRTSINYFIVSMAASDLLVPVFVLPRRIKQTYLGWHPWVVGGVLGDILCRFLHYTDEVSTTVSSQSMVFIAAERFWAVVFPLKPPLISKDTCPRFICFTWLFSMIFFSYYLVANKLVEENNTYSCIYTLPEVFDTWQDLWRVDRLSFLIIFGFIPFILMLVFYTATVLTLRRQEKNAIKLSLREQHRRTKSNQRITLMLITVVALFFISWTPYYVYLFLQYYPLGLVVSCNVRKKMFLSSRYMNYIYTAINPLIYYISNDTYRQGLYELFRCSLPCSKRFRQVNVTEFNNNEQIVGNRNDNRNLPEEVEVEHIS